MICFAGDSGDGLGSKCFGCINEYRGVLGIMAAFLAAIIVLIWPHYYPPSANRSFALLVFTIILWITGTIPLFVSALLVPILVVLLRLIRDKDGLAVEGPAAAHQILNAMFGGSIPVLLASFTIASCFLKYEIPYIIGNSFVDRLAARTIHLLLLVMASTVTLCMGMSNLSAGILIYTLLSSRLCAANLPTHHSRALLMGIAVAGNIGGFISPVSSTQNVFAYGLAEQTLGISWWDWMKVTVPCATLSVVASWALIVWIYQLDSDRTVAGDKAKGGMEEGAVESPPSLGSSIREIASAHVAVARERAPTWKLVVILATTLGTIILWSTASETVRVLGGMGIISFIPIVVLFGSGILETRDLQGLPWDIILLMMGALVLVEATRSSGLLTALTIHLRNILGSLHSWSQLAAVSFVLLVMSTFKSHTVAGLIFIPVVAHYVAPLGTAGLPLFMSAVMATSIGMAFPFSGLLNLMILAVRDGDGNCIVGMRDFLLVGIPASLITFLIIITITPLVSTL